MTVLILGASAEDVSYFNGRGIMLDVADLDPDEDVMIEDWLTSDDLFEAVIINLDKGAGMMACRAVRSKGYKTPIIGLSSRPDRMSWTDARCSFLEHGGDDLMHNPVNPRELYWSTITAIRRFRNADLSQQTLTLKGNTLKINLVNRILRLNEESIALTGREFNVLSALMRDRGRIFSKEAIMSSVYSLLNDEEPEQKIIDVFICKIRKKLEDAAPDGGQFLETVWGRGYRIVDDSTTAVKSTIDGSYVGDLTYGQRS